MRKSATVARLTAFAGALLLVVWIVTFVGPTSRFLMGWLVLIGAVYFFLYKLAQRVAFEIIRARGVTPPPEPDA